MAFYKKARTVASTLMLTGIFTVAPVVAGFMTSQVGLDVSFSSVAFAQDKKKISRALPGISNKIFEGTNKVAALANPSEEDVAKGKKPDLPKALIEIQKLEKRCIKEECNGYEMSQIYTMSAYINYQMENFKAAIGDYKKVIAQSPQIPIGVELNSLWYAAQLMYQEEMYQDSISHVEKYIKLAGDTGNEITPEIYHFLAVICYGDDDFKCAKKNINTAVSMVEAKDKIAEESWYSIQRALYINEEDYKTATPILEKMIRHYPKKTYYAQLPQLYGVLGREADQMNALSAAYVAGALHRESEIVNLSKLFLAEGVPYRAAKILEKGIKDKVVKDNDTNLSLLALAWRQAKNDKNAVPLLKAAADEVKTGEYHVQLLGVYLNLNDNKNAVAAGKEALRRGGLKDQDAGEVHVNMGIAYFDMRQYTNACESFDKGSKYKRYERFARGWKRYCENELARYNGLKKSLASLGLDIDDVIN